jgi:6-phosphogluconolactonase
MMTTSNQPLLFISGYAPAGEVGLQACRFDPANGALTSIASFSDIPLPGYVVAHPNGRWLYVASELTRSKHGQYGDVWALSYDARAQPFAFNVLNHQTSRGDDPCHLRLDATNRWLLVANYTSGSAAVYPVRADGSLGEMTDFVEHHGRGPNADRQAGAHVHSSIMSPDNRFAIFADLGVDQLVIYELDQATGKLRPHGAGSAEPGAGPRHMAFHPDGKHLYAANELNSTIALYNYDAAAGSLTRAQVLPTLPAADPSSTVADIHIDASGKRVLVSNRGHNSLAAFNIGAEGKLTTAGIWSCGGNWPRNFALAPGGRFVLVANQYSNFVSVLPLDGPGGLAGSAVATLPAIGPACIEFAPDRSA